MLNFNRGDSTVIKHEQVIHNGNMSMLSICIPTYNRYPLLKELLTVLLPQALSLGVKVRVSDNHSLDGTSELLATLQDQFPCLEFKRNQETVSLDENMCIAMMAADSVYAYPLGDDDFLPEGSLADIVDQLTLNPDLFVLSALHSDFKLVPKDCLIPSNLRGIAFNEPASAFRHLWDKMPFGSFLVKRDLIDYPSLKRYFGTSHAYTGAVWEKLAEKFSSSGEVSIRCMEKPTVLLRGGEKTWKSDEAKIFLFDIPLWFSLLPKIYSETTLPLLHKHLKEFGSTLTLLTYRRAGKLTRANCEHFMTFFDKQQRRKAMIISYLPPPVAGVLRLFFRNIPKLVRIVKRCFYCSPVNF
jgi:glycosyltransferase involved in cell wall biosynthesis